MKRALCMVLAALLLLSGCGSSGNALEVKEEPIPAAQEASDFGQNEADEDADAPAVVGDGRDRPSNSGKLQVIDGRL